MCVTIRVLTEIHDFCRLWNNIHFSEVNFLVFYFPKMIRMIIWAFRRTFWGWINIYPKEVILEPLLPKTALFTLYRFLKIQYFPQFLSAQLLSQHSESRHKYKMVIWHNLQWGGWSRRISSHSASWKAVICLYDINWDHRKGKASEKTQWDDPLMVNVIKSDTGNGDCHRRQRKEVAGGCTMASGNRSSHRAQQSGWKEAWTHA